jgi:primary-amine oxidase
VTQHPLDRLTAAEIDHARALIRDHDLLTPSTAFAMLSLAEPEKAEVLAFDGGEVDRQVRAVLLDVDTGASRTVLVSLTRKHIDAVVPIDPAVDGQPPIMLDEMLAIGDIVSADPGWQAAMARRGITDLEQVKACPLSAGNFDRPGERGRRLLRVLAFLAHREADHCWAHPIDGVVAYVDLTDRRVVELIDHELLPVPSEEGNFDDPAYVGPARTTLKPVEITQPAGPSFAVDGDVVRWEGWTFRIGFTDREGLVLHEVRVDERPLIYRASVAEMVVPYADPGPVRFWQNYFDIGEYLLGQQVNSLTDGCDCLGEIHYLDVVLAGGDGLPRTVPKAICLHEEDFGVLWKHSDLFTGSAETRRQRRMVVSSWFTIGNYDYGFFWYFYLDGTVEFEVKATGVMFTSAYRESPYAAQVAPGLGAPFHQHLYCVRLDLTVDGVENVVDELDVQRLPVGPNNPHGNAFTRVATRLSKESSAARLADASVARVWRVSNPDSLNRLGEPVSYLLIPEGRPPLLADSSSSIARRAAFATKHLWVTRYDSEERFPAGELINQHPGGAGLPAFVAADRPIEGEDIVVWHTLGTTHFPRTEDWPVMPVDRCGFSLRPAGFFDRNPTLDVPG